MIKTFKDKATATIFDGKVAKKLPGDLQARALTKLRMIEAATQLDDLRVPPANRLEALKGDRAGQYSIRINNQWRICFEWEEGHAYNVEITDYH
ncbi:type II toxin-antitoxin system RelE/ParE family toxin [Marinobacterium sp. D7]|uniref:type II toxin-antitoxin system RelE/ParE family toxin n=1 Tax=Marinobacterium ramblicola TaxID=2849041 RepID=UPI001C2DAFAC|nr:type II toxin-antitoxin system RelE/ParE family toxin [Marinobacterium ramblicola]MBV1787480.1 type II toxin-antitoxin system RelE/ParE family toxin [Marinobacterium ramblicola]